MLEETLNKAGQRYVAHHKQIEQRMDGSAGGVFSALVETALKEDFFFSGTVFDENLHVKHIVTNNPEDISKMAGYKPVQSETEEAFIEIKRLIQDGNRVLFCGTPTQCLKLRDIVGDSDSIILVDIINAPFIAQELLDKYAREIGVINEAKVTDIRFYDKEFQYEKSKRITLNNDRTIFYYERDNFDILSESGRYSVKDKNTEYSSLNLRPGDITIGSYKMRDADNQMGYSYLSVNSEKGDKLFTKAKKRLVIVKEGASVEEKCVRYRTKTTCQELKTEDFSKINHASLCGTRINRQLKNFIRPFILGLKNARWNPFIYFKFLRVNFFNKGVKTDFANNGFMYLTGHCALKLTKGFTIELHGPLVLGSRRIKESKQETRLRMEAGSRLLVKHSCSFGAGSNVEIYKDAFLEVGNINSNAELNIICGLHIKIGDTCNIARNATIRDTSGHIIAIPGYRKARPVELGNHTWICTQAVIMPGVTVGDGAIVGACSYVTKNVKPFELVQGTPAQSVGTAKYFVI